MYYTDSKTDPKIKEIAAAAFPQENKREFKVVPSKKVSLSGTYWDGGRKSYYVAVDIDTMTKVKLPEYDPPQFGGPSNIPVIDLNSRKAIVELSYYGQRKDIYIHLHPNNFSKLIKSGEHISLDEKIVLYSTKSFKPSYAGEKNYRFLEANRSVGISWERWNNAITSLINKKLLRKNKSITPAGRNLVSNYYDFPKG